MNSNNHLYWFTCSKQELKNFVLTKKGGMKNFVLRILGSLAKFLLVAISKSSVDLRSDYLSITMI